MDTNLDGPQAPLENDTRPRFNMRAVNCKYCTYLTYTSFAFSLFFKFTIVYVFAALWTRCAESNVYNRGQMINLQVSANPGPEQQQLFIRSCFVSSFPEPHTRPRHAVIMNKG